MLKVEQKTKTMYVIYKVSSSSQMHTANRLC